MSEELIHNENWKKAFRGSILSSVISKQVTYVGVSDQRAQGIIALNTLIVPLALRGMENEAYFLGSIVCILTSCFVILFATLSILHKQYKIDKSHPVDLLHFSHISRIPLSEYLETMRSEMVETNNLAVLAVRDIHYVASHVLARKFFWLKLAYITFLFGNFSGVMLLLYFSVFKII